ncbi:major capsid protein [Rheinheimera baltica]|uniref:major capsid protein n=1 Tax=Rheinheimera baltica TaxID=67576 RepID=UPI000418CD41|nr:major capsid protein [Rheinheimera baltica]
MPQMNNGQVRVIDPILTTHAQGYKQPTLVGSKLFPRVPVGQRGGQVIEFGKEAFLLYNARRAPGAGTKRVQFGYQGKPYALLSDSLEGVVPREHIGEAAVPGIKLGQRATNNVMRSLMLALEHEQAALARNPANYDANHKVDLAATKWSNPDNSPSDDIETGREAIRASIGVYPNVVLLSAKAFAAAKNNPHIVERFKYTSKESITAEMLASLWDVPEVVVGGAVVADQQSGDFSDVWGNDVVMAYVAAESGDLNIEEPSFGYTYTLDGNPLVEQAYYENNAKSWMYPVTYERSPVLSGITAGYLMQNVV